MQTTSATYQAIITSDNYWFNPKLEYKKANGTWATLTKANLFSLSTKHSLFADGVPEIGCAVAGEFTASFLAVSDMPRMAEIRLYVQAENDSQTSEWIQKGTYFVDTRETSNNTDSFQRMTITGYDAMLKFEQMYPSDDNHNYPLLDLTMLQFMASQVGVTIDPRTTAIMDRGYTFSLPAGYTMREMLGYIASAYCGNFIISDEGKLLLIQLGSEPIETFYLVDENGNAITFGGDRILLQ